MEKQNRILKIYPSTPFFFTFLILLSLGACHNQELPILGPVTEKDGKTIPHSIPDFSFVNQDSMIITNETFAGKPYVVDFFFTSCPTICPMLTQQMLRIHDQFKNTDLRLISHTIDTKRDSVTRLKEYADNLGVSSEKWHFVTGNKDSIYDIADDYFSIIVEDETLESGYDHSGRLILVDKDRHIRSYCNGTDQEDDNRFIEDIETLLHEEN